MKKANLYPKQLCHPHLVLMKVFEQKFHVTQYSENSTTVPAYTVFLQSLFISSGIKKLPV
jgi:hypothetical protein